MGASTSRNYPNDISINDYQEKTLVMNTRPALSNSLETGVIPNANNDFRKQQYHKLLKKLESNLNMYALYDNYQNKNEVMLLDLKKKAKNQEEELKELIESRDKLKALFDTKRDDTNDFSDTKNILNTVNIILFIILLATLVFIIYKLYIYPIDKENNVQVSDLLNLTNNDLSNLSLNELNSLEQSYNEKINNIQLNNNISFSPRQNSNSNSNKSNTPSN